MSLLALTPSFALIGLGRGGFIYYVTLYRYIAFGEGNILRLQLWHHAKRLDQGLFFCEPLGGLGLSRSVLA
jgi:hypothetical protein